jgi:hypothetical protein
MIAILMMRIGYRVLFKKRSKEEVKETRSNDGKPTRT